MNYEEIMQQKDEYDEEMPDEEDDEAMELVRGRQQKNNMAKQQQL